MRKIWQEEAWEDYLYWQTQDKKTLKRIKMNKKMQTNQCLYFFHFVNFTFFLQK